MNVVDTSGWLEYLMDGAGADFFEAPLLSLDQLIVPSISLFEVYRVLLRERGKDVADDAMGLMVRGQIIDLDVELATSAAGLAHVERLGMADAIILTTAKKYNAVVWTQDADLKDFPNVKYREKTKGS